MTRRYRMKLALGVTLMMMGGFAQAITISNVACTNGATYNITWDGWNNTLKLKPGGTGTLGTHHVRWQLANQQDWVDGMQGPGYIGVNSTDTHRIVFWVDFGNTPANTGDDQRFDGYVFTQTHNAMAGVTWWAGIPFGFYAANKACSRPPPSCDLDPPICCKKPSLPQCQLLQ